MILNYKETHKSSSGISSKSFSAPQNKPFRREYNQNEPFSI